MIEINIREEKEEDSIMDISIDYDPEASGTWESEKEDVEDEKRTTNKIDKDFEISIDYETGDNETVGSEKEDKEEDSDKET